MRFVYPCCIAKYKINNNPIMMVLIIIIGKFDSFFDQGVMTNAENAIAIPSTKKK